MAKPKIYTLNGIKAIVLPYDGFAKLGVQTIPPVPAIAVPLFDSVEEALAAAEQVVEPFEEELVRIRVPQVIERAMASGYPSWLSGLPPAYAAKLAFSFPLFRGESRNEYGIMPTILRFRSQLDFDEVVSHRRTAERRNARIMQAALLARTRRRASFQQARAAARHYGGPSSLVDFSFSPKVSGYFGHPKFTQADREAKAGPPIGIIYCIKFEFLNEMFGIAGIKPDSQGAIDHTFYNVYRAWTVPYMSYDEKQQRLVGATLTVPVPVELVNTTIKIRCVPVSGIRRIGAQQGVFVEIISPHFSHWMVELLLWYLVDFATEKWCFCRQDYAYTDSSEGITESGILPSDGPIISLAAGLLSRR